MLSLKLPNQQTSTSKSYRMIKLKRKTYDFDRSAVNDEEDLALENSGDIKEYLNPGPIKFKCPRYDPAGGIVAHSVIGPISIFSGSKDPLNNLKRMPTVSKKKKSADEANPKLMFQQMLDKISNLRQHSLIEEKKKQKNISQRQKLFENRQGQVMQSFQQKVTYWKSIESGLAVKSRKTMNDLIYKKSQNSRTISATPEKISGKNKARPSESTMMWYMKLRESAEDEKFEAFLNVGSDLNGLYTRVQIKKNKLENEDEVIAPNPEDINELQVIGLSKLPLEIEAVERVGCQYLKPELLDLNKDEETIAEHYERKLKAKLV